VVVIDARRDRMKLPCGNDAERQNKGNFHDQSRDMSPEANGVRSHSNASRRWKIDLKMGSCEWG
jgi:hypothetical protein